MADCSYLEKMGRELKCPICLSLLNASVSLSCNHVFCNSCIEKSMKSASSCPVCKVPYRRRGFRKLKKCSGFEDGQPNGKQLVRPAPHMDNLVNIYKNMVVASGVNVFDTQTKIPEAFPDEDKQIKSSKSGRQQKNRRKNKRSKPSKSNHENENGDQGKPSFPRKKRVQVPNPSQEQDQQANLGLEPIPLKKMAAVDAEKPSFTPFFWLRDEDDVENPSDQTDLCQNTYTPPNVQCFDDMKDSGDELPDKNSPNDGKDITSNNADCYDSEMFEWTQRPCSPELCTSPLKTHVEDTEEENVIPEKEIIVESKCASNSGSKEKHKNKVNVVPKQREDNAEVSLVNLLTLGTRNASKRNCRLEKTKQNSEKVGAIKKTRVSKTKVDSEEKAESPIPKDNKTKSKSLGSGRPSRTKIKKVNFGNAAIKQVPNNISVLSTEECNMVLDNLATDKPASLHRVASKSQNNTQKRKDYSNSLKVKSQSESKCAREPRQLKKQKISTDILPKDNRSVVCDGSNEVSMKDNKCKAKDQLPTSIQGLLRRCDSVSSKFECAFCHSSDDSEATGAMVHYFNGKPVSADYSGGSKLKHVHRNCTEWAPNVYFEDDNAINLEAELTRSRRIKCCCCDLKGAALGCYETSCRKSFHVPCAKLVPECRWDNDNFVMLCPIHSSSKLPHEMGETKQKRSIVKKPSQSLKHENVDNNVGNMHQKWSTHRSSGNIVLCCSALTNEEKDIVSKFKKLSGITVLKNWDSRVTHVIASVDENGACRRTLKFLMGILEGKWILSTDWLKACVVAMEPVDEQLYEVGVDIHGIREGPRLGRLRVLDKQPKIFNGFKFYLIGDFVPSYKGYLHDLVVVAGGTVLQRKPISTDQKSPSFGNHTSIFIIYSVELPDKSDSKKGNVILNLRRQEAEALASSTGAIVVNNTWVLNSIAAGKLQTFQEK